MNFDQFPLIHQVLNEQFMTPLKVIGHNMIICKDTEDKKYLMKTIRGLEDKIFTEVFPQISKQNPVFKTLLIPNQLKSISTTLGQKKYKYIFIEYYDGEKYNDIWDESSPQGLGGRGINISLAKKIVDILSDFSKIDLKLLNNLNLPDFDLQIWLDKIFPIISRRLTRSRVLTDNHVEKAFGILSNPDLFKYSRKIITNGDFYPRNFITLKNDKVVIIDWEARKDEVFKGVPGMRNSLINFTENHLTFLYVHMWANQSFQNQILHDAIRKFKIKKVDLQASLLVKSLEQSHLWLYNLEQSSHLTLSQAQIFIDALDQDFIDNIYHSK